MSHTFSGGIQLNDKWSIDVLYVLIDSFTYGHRCDDSNVNGRQPYDTCAAGDAVAAQLGRVAGARRASRPQVFWATLGYQPLDWLGLSLAWINWAPLQQARLELPPGHHLHGLQRVHHDPARRDDHRRQAGGKAFEELPLST